MVRRCADRLRSPAALLLAAVGCALVLVLAGSGRSSETDGAPARDASTPVHPGAAVPSRAGSTYTLMQMNLCLSGLGGCYGKVSYPAGVNDAVARIRAARPDAVTLNEVCRDDVVRIARRLTRSTQDHDRVDVGDVGLAWHRSASRLRRAAPAAVQ